MKSNLLYYILVFAPFPLMIYAAEVFGSGFFAASLLTYCFIYRPFIDYNRLVSLKAIGKGNMWRFFIPFYYFRYTDILFLGKQ